MGGTDQIDCYLFDTVLEQCCIANCLLGTSWNQISTQFLCLVSIIVHMSNIKYCTCVQ